MARFPGLGACFFRFFRLFAFGFDWNGGGTLDGAGLDGGLVGVGFPSPAGDVAAEFQVNVNSRDDFVDAVGKAFEFAEKEAEAGAGFDEMEVGASFDVGFDRRLAEGVGFGVAGLLEGFGLEGGSVEFLGFKVAELELGELLDETGFGNGYGLIFLAKAMVEGFV